MKNKYSLPGIPGLLAALFLSAACASTTVSTDAANEKVEQLLPVNSIAVLPTELPVVPDLQDKKKEDIATGASFLTEELAQYFAGNEKVDIISANQKEALNPGTSGNRLRQARETASQLGYDAVLVSTVTRYAQRDGGNLSAGSPASVAFDYQLIAVGNGQTLCAGAFDETQKALSENLFSFAAAASRGFRWITAEELAREGLKKKLDSCSYLQAGRPGK